MKPGRELDALVAEKVMGWLKGKRTYISPYGPEHNYDFEQWINEDEIEKELPAYSTNILAAWEVIEHLKDNRRIFYCIEQHPFAEEPTVWLFDADKVPEGMVIADHAAKWNVTAATIPHAICLAALKAVEVQL